MLTFSVLAFVSAVAAAAATVRTTITTDRSVAVSKTFDYIVVGGGLTGITVGNKLSGKGYSVLIIEAGPDPQNVPAVYNAEDRSNLDGYCNWEYPAYDEKGNLLSWSIDSGACIGGSTSINGMVWFRPTKTEMDTLQLLGNPGWNWSTLEPYMEAVERFIPPDETQIADGAGYDPAVHGFNGPLNTSFPTPMRIPEAQKLYKEAFPLIFPGLTVGDDLSNRTSIASASNMWTIWYDPVTAKNRRSSAADAFLWATDQQRKSLIVLAEHKVSKILFKNGRDLAASGVQFGNASDGKLYEVYARKEVLLAAGSLASAPILERSGIGSSSVLKKAGVKQVLNLPGVGVNLNDQPGTGTEALVAEQFWNDTSLIDGRNLFAPVISLVNTDELFGSGNTSQINKDLQKGLTTRAKDLVNAGAAVSLTGALAILGAVTNNIVNAGLPVAEIIGESYPTVLMSAFWPLMPLSRGYVHINTTNPFVSPVITPRLLTDSFDQKVAVAIARKSRGLFTSAPFAEVVANAYADPSTVGPNATDADYLAWYKAEAYGASHWIGSTSMLPQALGGVVDPRLRVYGTKNLRVVDAGILPFQLTTHTMPALYAIAQKAADIILDDA